MPSTVLKARFDGEHIVLGEPFDLRSDTSLLVSQQVAGFDEVIEPSQPVFARSGLKAVSLIRLGFLATLPGDRFPGTIGFIARERHGRLPGKLSKFPGTEQTT